MFYNTLIFDIGDVLFTWSSTTSTSISSKTLRQILTSPTWFEYERGKLTEDACYDAVGAAFSIHPGEIRQALLQARKSLKSNDRLIALIRELKEQANGALRVVAMSNISVPDYQVLQTKKADWDIFDHIFTSAEAGERKPHLGFYRYVFKEVNIDPQRAVFVDDKIENVISARSLGLHGIVFAKGAEETVIRSLRNLLGDPVARGRAYLRRNSRLLHSITDTPAPIILRENFAQLLILELTNDKGLIDIEEHPRAWNFFHAGKGTLTTQVFPYDLDTTSIGLTVMERDKEIANSVMNEMLEYVDSDGIILTYFDHQRPRIDPVVCVNVLHLFHKHHRGDEVQPTLQWVSQVLQNRAYLDGTRYYATAECFLYFLARFLVSSRDGKLYTTLAALLKERLQERIGIQGDALQLAMRMTACAAMGIKDTVDLENLLALQSEDGGFQIGWMYKYGSSGINIGNRGLTTAFAIHAIERVTELSGHPPSEPIQRPTLTRRFLSFLFTHLLSLVGGHVE